MMEQISKERMGEIKSILLNMIKDEEERIFKVKKILTSFGDMMEPSIDEFTDLYDLMPISAEDIPDATDSELMTLNFLRVTGTEEQFDEYKTLLKNKYV